MSEREHKTEDLINKLTDDLKPVKRMSHPVAYIMPWIVFSLLYLAFAAYMLGTRPNALEKIYDLTFDLEIASAFGLYLAATFLSAFLCIPDMRGARWMRYVPITFFTIVCGWAGYHLIQEGLHDYSIHWGCLMDGMIMVMIPAIVLLIMCQRGKTTQPLLMTGMNIIAAGALAYIGLRFTCMNDHADHGLFHHILPWVVLAGLMGLFSRRIFRW